MLKTEVDLRQRAYAAALTRLRLGPDEPGRFDLATPEGKECIASAIAAGIAAASAEPEAATGWEQPLKIVAGDGDSIVVSKQADGFLFQLRTGEGAAQVLVPHRYIDETLVAGTIYPEPEGGELEALSKSIRGRSAFGPSVCVGVCLAQLRTCLGLPAARAGAPTPAMECASPTDTRRPNDRHGMVPVDSIEQAVQAVLPKRGDPGEVGEALDRLMVWSDEESEHLAHLHTMAKVFGGADAAAAKWAENRIVDLSRELRAAWHGVSTTAARLDKVVLRAGRREP